jgi:serine/threonine protein kinase/tetratricopeptide (TPR) repeat protein
VRLDKVRPGRPPRIGPETPPPPLPPEADAELEPPFPGAGDEIFGYRVREELGRGAFARVFLAEQADLADRLVVLKVSAAEGGEPQMLAQMQHTHIVPIYSLHEDRRLGLRAVCMPYLGGATLTPVLRRLWAAGPPPAHGSQLAEALAAVGSPSPTTSARSGAGGCAALEPFRDPDYCRCAARVVVGLADALQHAHDRGVLHRDVKPSNILLSAEGEPLLLDFNISGRPGRDAMGSSVGGTAAYAAPEHLAALLRPAPELVARVDQRSDIYALGIVLFELLAGGTPFEQQGSSTVLPGQLAHMIAERAGPPVSVRSRRPDVPWSLDSIVRRCLESEPRSRYQHAGHLAEDLRRYLDDRPLRHAPEPSRAERLRKWLRRHPRLTSSGSVAAVCGVLLLVFAAAGGAAWARLAQARTQLQELQTRERRAAYEAGTLRALCLVSTVTDRDDHVVEGIRVCEATLALYDVLGRSDWQDQPAWQQLGPDERRRLSEDTRELLHLLASARVRAAPGDRGALRVALRLLDRAETIAGLSPSRAVRSARADYLEQLGDTGARRARDEAEATAPAGASDHYLLATAQAGRGGRAGLVRAVAELNRALRLNPQHYWALMQRGICHHELDDYLAAVADFSTCAGLWPEFAWAYFNRGCVLMRAGKRAEARDEFSAALERDPAFVLAYVNRGLARLELKEHAAALDDFDRAAALGRDDARVHAGRGIALEAVGRSAEADAAFVACFARAGALPTAARARLGWTYGFAISRRRPDQAAQAFDAVLRDDPAQPQALYGRAMLAAERGDLAEAGAFADRAVAADPAWPDARRCRAIVRARRGDFAAAEADVNWCLEREPAVGATLYAAACVAARAAARFPASAAAGQAVDFLRRAFAEDYGRDRAETDPDLAAIRHHPGFVRLLCGK